MKKEPLQILLVEDNPGDARLLREYLHGTELDPVKLDIAERLIAGLEHLVQNKPDIILLDLGLPDSQGMGTFTQVYAQAQDVPIVILTGLNDSIRAAEAIKAGAQDYLIKAEVNGSLLVRSIRYSLGRTRAKEMLEQSEKRFRAMIEHSGDAIDLVSAEGKIKYRSPISYSILGLESATPAGNSMFTSVHPDDMEEMTKLFAQLSRSPNEPIPFLGRLQHTDGSWRWIEGTGTNLLTEPAVSAIVINYRDISQRKQAENEIRHRITDLETLHENGLTLSQLLNPKEIGRKLIELLEQKMNWHHTIIRLQDPQNETLELLAFSQPNLEDKEQKREAWELFSNRITKPGQGLTGWAIQNSKTVRSGDVSSDPRYIEAYPGMHSGLYVPISSRENIIGVISIESEKPNAFSETDERLVATLANQAAVAIENARLFQAAQQEILQRKKFEALLADERNQLAQRVEERTAELTLTNLDLARVLRSRDDFLASMSHELRTPLTGILGFSETLHLRTYGELNEKQLNAVKIIEDSGRHLLTLINDILELSKIEAGKLDLNFEPCSLADICQASLQLTKGMAHQRNHKVEYTPAPEPIMLHADARRLKQILVNLLSNAIKFTPENGRLGLEVQVDEAGRRVKLTVWDKGIGIAPGNMHKLFKPFVQLDSSFAREYSGSGLGLSLVQRLTELHNGGIEVESVVGEGSRFTVSLPWSPQNTTPIPYVPLLKGEELSGTKNKVEQSKLPLVMIADDNEMFLQMIAEFLEIEQFRVVKVHSGIELLEKIADIHPDVILMDIQMPRMDGLETIRRVRAHADSLIAETPIIAITALAMPGDRELCLSAGANNYVSKPLRLREIARIIQKELEKKHELRQATSPG